MTRLLGLVSAALILIAVCAFARSVRAESSPEIPVEPAGTLGKVTQIDSDSITIALGAAADFEAAAIPSGEAVSGASALDGGGAGQHASGLALTGGTLIFAVNSDTTYTVSGASGSLSEIRVGDIVTVSLTNGVATDIQAGTPPTASDEASDGGAALSGVYTVDGAAESADGQAITSQTAGESAVLVQNGGNLTLTNATLLKSAGTDQGDSAGSDAAALIASGGAASILDSALTTSAKGSSAVLSTGEGSSVRLDNVTISTTGDSACGLNAADGGVITAKNADISTTGLYCPPLSAGLGGGIVRVDTAALSASGDASPIIHSTGSVTGARLNGTATGGPMVVIEGEGSVSLSDSNLTGADGSGVMLYQGGSGEASEETASFTASNCKLNVTSDGPFFSVTSARAKATLSASTLTYSSGILAQIAGTQESGRGASGKDGSDFTLTGVGQVLSGDVAVDGVSAFKLSLTSGSIYTGAVNGENAGGSVTVSLDDASSWTLTADSHVDALIDDMADLSNIQSGGFTLYYDASNALNDQFGGATFSLPGGGLLTPEA